MFQSISTVEIDSAGIKWNQSSNQYHHFIKTYRIIDLPNLLTQSYVRSCKVTIKKRLVKFHRLFSAFFTLPRQIPPPPSTRYCNFHRFAAWSTCESSHNLLPMADVMGDVMIANKKHQKVNKRCSQKNSSLRKLKQPYHVTQ